MRELVTNCLIRTGDAASTALSSAISSIHLATYFGFTYVAISAASSFVHRLVHPRVYE